MDPAHRKLWIETLKAQVALRQYIRASLVMEFEDPGSTSARKARVAYLWDGAGKDASLAQFLVDLLERQAREENGEPSFGAAPQRSATG